MVSFCDKFYPHLKNIRHIVFKDQINNRNDTERLDISSIANRFHAGSEGLVMPGRYKTQGVL